MTLTAAGDEVMSQAEKLVTSCDALLLDRSVIRFSSYPSVVAKMVKGISDFEERNEAVRIELYDVADRSRDDKGASLVRRTLEGEIDVSIAPSGQAEPALTERPMYSWHLRVVLPSTDQRCSRAEITLKELQGSRFAVSPDGHMSHEKFDALVERSSQSVSIAVVSPDQTFLRELGLNGTNYAAVIPDDAFPEGVCGPKLVNTRRRTINGSYSLYFLSPPEDEAKRTHRTKNILEFCSYLERQALNEPEPQ